MVKKKEQSELWRIVFDIHVDIEAKSKEEAIKKFGDLNLGKLDDEQKKKKVVEWDYREVVDTVLQEK